MERALYFSRTVWAAGLVSLTCCTGRSWTASGPAGAPIRLLPPVQRAHPVPAATAHREPPRPAGLTDAERERLFQKFDESRQGTASP